MDATPPGRLAPELRNKIYEHLFQDTTAVPTSQPYREPAILYASRQLHSEASLLFYKHTRFVLAVKNHDTSAAISWLKRLDPKEAAAITSLTVRLVFPAGLKVDQHPNNELAYDSVLQTALDAGVRPSAIKSTDLNKGVWATMEVSIDVGTTKVLIESMSTARYWAGRA